MPVDRLDTRAPDGWAAEEGRALSSGPHTLLYWPAQQAWSIRTDAELALGDARVLAIQRTLGPDLAFSASYAFVGAALLPEADRPSFGGGVAFLWLPLLPHQCLFTARDASGTYRVVTPPEQGADALVRTLGELEVECAWAFEEALAADGPDLAVRQRLDAVFEQAAVAALLFGDLLGGRPFWQGAPS